MSHKMPLIKLYMRYLRMGVKSYVRGQDIGLNLLRMVDKTEQIVLNVSLQKDGVFARLYDDLFEERNRLMIKRGMDLEDATLSNQIMNKYDSIKALEILAEGLTSARDLHDRIENVFAESADGVCLSTIHKAKGLEANNVYILCKTLMPSRLATQDWEKEQEQNLMYVAYTRAKYKLGFVSETEISPSAGMIDPSAALTELNYIENKICKLLNKTPQVIMDATEVAQYNLKSATIIEEKETNHAEISSNNNEDSDSETMKKLLELVKKKVELRNLKNFLNNKNKKVKKILHLFYINYLGAIVISQLLLSVEVLAGTVISTHTAFAPVPVPCGVPTVILDVGFLVTSQSLAVNPVVSA